MKHISLTPFGRQQVTAGLLAARALGATPPALPSVDKWALFNDLRVARDHFRVTDRDLSVLYALLTFLPAKKLEESADLVVFPSNASLCDRAHGMAESTLRRHMAALVQAGLIWRQDSPNGKRYAARDRSGAVLHAFGFDLRPLLTRATEIAAIAAETEAATLALRRMRETLVLRMRDAAKLLAYGREAALPGDWDAIEARLLPLRAALRRRMDAAVLARMLDQSVDILAALRGMISIITEDSVVTAAHSGRHHTNSTKDSCESEPCLEEGRAPDAPAPHVPDQPSLPLALVLKACPDIQPYARTNLTSWRDFVTVAAEVRGMMGISASAWTEASRIMGPETAAVVVGAMLQRIGTITNPGGYLRALTGKAASGAFSVGPMVMALLNTETARAA
jgi:replication initiation protein RepC